MFKKAQTDLIILQARISSASKTYQSQVVTLQKLVITHGQRNPNVFHQNLKKATEIKLCSEVIEELKKMVSFVQNEQHASKYSNQFLTSFFLLHQIVQFYGGTSTQRMLVTNISNVLKNLSHIKVSNLNIKIPRSICQVFGSDEITDHDEANFLFECLSARKDLPCDYFNSNLMTKPRVLQILNEKLTLSHQLLSQFSNQTFSQNLSSNFQNQNSVQNHNFPQDSKPKYSENSETPSYSTLDPSHNISQIIPDQSSSSIVNHFSFINKYFQSVLSIFTRE
jgi:hypothetical protein